MYNLVRSCTTLPPRLASSSSASFFSEIAPCSLLRLFRFMRAFYPHVSRLLTHTRARPPRYFMPVVQLPSVSSTSRGHAQHARRQTTLWTRADRDFPSACAREERRRTRTWTRRRWYHRSAVVSIPPRRTSSRCPSAASSQHPRHEPFASNVGSSATREFLLFVRSDRRSRSSPGQTDPNPSPCWLQRRRRWRPRCQPGAAKTGMVYRRLCTI